ncbi:tetrapyrrole methylase family protein / MazG family protein [Marininema mesophilum]|uniref:Tetrapyrrole methylase family protein / MazG family protein n=1 Tax=Marininema mesophilum TaxID=1048340 RepID=A0A1H2X130_9BACL|nr:nucleoside triphosphate pyrophosphohydrolase [Marininema mesophilum]SDW86466.1 tetrapyrrole methylase family protein / MazG family protein [Marininema mesophilum]
MATVTVIGLGSGDEENLSLGSLRLMKAAERLYFRTEKHPVVSWLIQEGISFTTFDSIYEKHGDFISVYQEIADRLLAEAATGQDLVYAVPGHPTVAETTVQRLLAQGKSQGVTIDIRGGGSFLDTSFARLGIDPNDGFMLLDGTSFSADHLDPRFHILISQVYDRMTASDVKLTLMEIYPDDHPVLVVTALGIKGAEKIEEVPLWELDHEDRFSDLSSVYLAPTTVDEILRRRFATVVYIVAHLRSPKGCPWDQKQTHESLRPYLLEEAYEYLEAVDQGDSDAMTEELGDVLLQVLLHAQIGSETGEFNIQDVIGTLADKLIRRHPHVFGKDTAKTVSDVKLKWEEIKEQEGKGKADHSSLLDGIPMTTPTLLRAYELQKKAAKVGFDWPDIAGTQQKLTEEAEELVTAPKKKREEEAGDLLFSAINMIRWLEVDPEQALLAACRKFQRRFHYIEAKAHQQGVNVASCSLKTLDTWWDEAKTHESDARTD